VALQDTERRAAALGNDLTRIVTRLLSNAWEKFLADAGVLEEFREVPKGLRCGFTLGLEEFSLSRSFYPEKIIAKKILNWTLLTASTLKR
jgi:hypothetical protein